MQIQANLRGRRPIYFYTILCTAVDLGVYPVGDYRGHRGQAFYVGTKGGWWSHMSHRKPKDSISHSMIMYEWEEIDMLKNIVENFHMWNNRILTCIIANTQYVYRAYG